MDPVGARRAPEERRCDSIPSNLLPDPDGVVSYWHRLVRAVHYTRSPLVDWIILNPPPVSRHPAVKTFSSGGTKSHGKEDGHGFFSPSSASTHKQLFNEFEQVPILNSALFSQTWIRLASGDEESI